MSNKLTIKEMQEIALLKGGKCLSKKYTNVHEKLIWQCNKGHIWQASPNCIKNRGQWCPDCYKEKRVEASKSRVHLETKKNRQITEQYNLKKSMFTLEERKEHIQECVLNESLLSQVINNSANVSYFINGIKETISNNANTDKMHKSNKEEQLLDIYNDRESIVIPNCFEISIDKLIIIINSLLLSNRISFADTKSSDLLFLLKKLSSKNDIF